jgi:hypothetical protein
MTQLSLGSMDPTIASIVTNLNYLMQNSGLSPNGVTINPQTGVISNQYANTPISYANQYLLVAYATNSTGTENFSIYPTNATYYGLRNQATTAPDTNSADYLWYPVGGSGFGTTNFLFYSVIGGRQVEFFVGSMAPNLGFEPSEPGVPINLNLTTLSQNSTGNASSANTAVTVTGNAQPNITSVGTLINLTSSGEIAAAFFNGSGGQLYGLTAANVVGTVNFANVVVNNAQPNITSVGRLTSISATGNISTSGNVTANFFIGNGSQLTNLPIVYGNANVANFMPIFTGNISANNFTSSGNIRGNNIRSLNIIQFGNYTRANLVAITGSIGQATTLSDSTPAGQLVYWNATTGLWNYVMTNTPI